MGFYGFRSEYIIGFRCRVIFTIYTVCLHKLE